MMKYYPIYIKIEGKPCTVIGGGEVGERKVVRLLECGAQVTVLAQVITPALRALRDEGRIRCIHEPYEPKHLTDAFLVIGATDRDDVNAKIAADCRGKGIMVNIVDDPGRCDFILPSLFEQGDLSIAVSTAGKSPALAKRIRRELETAYGAEYAVLLQIMGTLREIIMAAGRPSVDNRTLFEALLDSPILEEIRQQRWDRVRQMIKDISGIDLDLPEGG
jgi:precorrin-2 dehydrogenase / sirohydrochlorin ferrochelatase